MAGGCQVAGAPGRRWAAGSCALAEGDIGQRQRALVAVARQLGAGAGGAQERGERVLRRGGEEGGRYPRHKKGI